MPEHDLWKYCTPEQCREMILSLRLLEPISMTEAEQLRCLYGLSRHAARHYRPAEIPKKTGGTRHLMAPDDLLKTVQRNILRNVLARRPVSPRATAYRKGGGILANAAPHVGQPQLLRLDIRDFFGSITFPMVYARAFPGHLFPPQVRGLLTHLCCRLDVLPQGAPTSPAISNLVMLPFDAHMAVWCREREITYTRYCDDMTFSGVFDPRAIKAKVRGFLDVMGFSLNESKTRLVYPGSRQQVTGIVVNEKPQADREYRRRVRQEVHYCGKYGSDAHLRRMTGTVAPATEEAVREYLTRLLGRINFILHVNPEDPWFVRAREEVQNWILATQ